MTFNTETMMWATAKLDRVAHMKGFPQKEEGIQAVTRGILKIAHPALVSARTDQKPLTDKDIQDHLALSPGELDLIVVKHPKLDFVNPMDWLIEAIADHYDWFPSLVEMRRRFSEAWKPADGNEAESDGDN